MSLQPEHQRILESFLDRADFGTGGVFLDLDGVALLEMEGQLSISGTIERGVGLLGSLGRPVILNTLRFPLTVIRDIAPEWIAVYGARIPAVLMNGSVLGHIVDEGGGRLGWHEEASFPMDETMIAEIVKGFEEIIKSGSGRTVILFLYPRDWQQGEIIWTPNPSHMAHVREKYLSATSVVSWPIVELLPRMAAMELCMAAVIVDQPHDERMAYQHDEPMSFFSSPGVDKAFGAREFAKIIGISLPDSAGAGDTEMDAFLSEVGLAALVGPRDLPFRGLRETVRIRDPHEAGELITLLGELWQRRRKGSTTP
jgi:hypothetical protein